MAVDNQVGPATAASAHAGGGTTYALRATGLGSDPWLLAAWDHMRLVMGIRTSEPVTVNRGGEPAWRLDVSSPVQVWVTRTAPFRGGAADLRAAVHVCRPVVGLQVDPASIFEVDVFAWAAWLLSRDEERQTSQRDQHGRFHKESSVAAAAGLSDTPILDIMIEALKQRIVAVARGRGIHVYEHSPWPSGKTFAVALSHDIDDAIDTSISVAGRKVIAAALAAASANWPRARRRMSDARGLASQRRVSPYWCMQRMADMEESQSCSSTFFVLGHTSRVVKEAEAAARRYDVSSPEVRRMLRGLAETGAELALHISYDGADRLGELGDEAQQVSRAAGRPVRGARGHYLRVSVPETFEAERRVGLRWDATLGWARGWGYRQGTGYPVRHLLGTGRHLWTVGLHLMDVAVPADQFLGAATRLIDIARATGGCASILVHPNPWDERSVAQHLALYADLLETVARSGDAWVATHSEIVEAAAAHLAAMTAD